MNECLYEFVSRQNLTTNYDIICHWVSEISLYDLVTTLAFSFLSDLNEVCM